MSAFQKKPLPLVLGLMSGTSTDGIDLALCRFSQKKGKWDYEIVRAETMRYTPGIKRLLLNAHLLSGSELASAHLHYGKILADNIQRFLKKIAHKPGLIASHGHTIFHQPGTLSCMQLGHGGVIASMTGIPCVSDFRIQDIILGGQGAPLVPMGDVALFSEFDACLNLGGICNISYRKNKVVKAYDIAPCNLPLNSVISSLGKNYDKNGALASRGKPDSSLLRALNQLSFYGKPGPKSLGREWLETKFFPVLAPYQHVSVPDLLFTLCEHIAFQIARVIRKEKLKKVLVSGGGAHHRLLIQRIQIYAPDAQIVVSDRLTTDFKEALIFAFLGLLRWQSLPNTLPSVTGAEKASSSGSIWLP